MVCQFPAVSSSRISSPGSGRWAQPVRPVQPVQLQALPEKRTDSIWFPVLFNDWWMFHTWGLEALKLEDQFFFKWYKWYVLQLKVHKLLAHPFFSTLAESEPLPLALPWVSPLEVPLWARQELLSAPSKGPTGTNGDQRGPTGTNELVLSTSPQSETLGLSEK